VGGIDAFFSFCFSGGRDGRARRRREALGGDAVQWTKALWVDGRQGRAEIEEPRDGFGT
jgi:hypothetical protein